jgi:hypothetical protein
MRVVEGYSRAFQEPHSCLATFLNAISVKQLPSTTALFVFCMDIFRVSDQGVLMTSG